MNPHQLVPCAACGRHVRRVESVCPFCGDTTLAATATAIPDAPSRLSRAGVLAFAAVVGAAACSSPQPVAVTPPPAQPEAPPPAPVEPPPAAPVEVDAGAPEVIDAGAPEVDAGSLVVDSGTAARRDAGVRRPGTNRVTPSMGVRYGAPPRPED